MQNTPTPVTQPPTTEPPTNNRLGGINRIPFEYIIEAVIFASGIVLCIYTLQFFHTSAQKASLKNTGHYIPNKNQYDLFIGKDENSNIWPKELNIINTTQNSAFFASNECYRFAIIKCQDKWQVTFNNQLQPLGTIDSSNIEQIEDTEYREYLNYLFKTTNRFIVEFRKKSNTLFFYKLKSALLIDRVFKLKGDDFIGLKIQKYQTTGYDNFLMDLKVEPKSTERISMENPKYRHQLNCLMYFYINGLFKNSIVQLFRDCLLILDKEFQFVLFGDYESLVCEFFGAAYKRNLHLMEEYKNDGIYRLKEKENMELIDLFKNPTTDYKIIFQSINRGNVRLLLFVEGENKVRVRTGQISIELKFSEYFRDYFKSLFNKGEMSKVLQVMKYKQLKYQKEWVSILKESDHKVTPEVKRQLVESFYDYKTGWDAFDEGFEVNKNQITLKDIFRGKVAYGKEWFYNIQIGYVCVE